MSELCRLRRSEQYGACAGEEKVERRGKSSPNGVSSAHCCKLYPEQRRGNTTGRPGRVQEAAGAYRQRCA